MPYAANPGYWFNRCLSCSEAMFTILNRACGAVLETEEQAAHALAGGVLRQGHACGLLWGSALEAGLRARSGYADDPETAGVAAVIWSGRLVEEFRSFAGAVNCREIIQGPLNTMKGRLAYIISGKPGLCARNAVGWWERADKIFQETLEPGLGAKSAGYTNCAVEMMKRLEGPLGLVPEDKVLAAGFAGGLGLSGNACGALAAAIFALGLKYYRGRKAGRDTFRQALLQEIGIGADFIQAPARLRQAFVGRYKTELCREIAGTGFDSLAAHSAFLSEGGCRELLDHVSAWTQEAAGRGNQ